MQIQKTEKQEGISIRFAAHEDEKEIGRASLIIFSNDLHPEPYGIMEDVFVEEAFRGKGIGRELVHAVIREAKARGCYKLLAFSRYEKSDVHEMYVRYGFTDWGKEFRMNL